MTAKLAITLRVILFSIICPLILIVAGPLGRLVPSSGGPLLIGIVASLFTFALTLLFVRWEKIGLGDIGAGFSRQTAPRLLFGFAIGAAIVALQDIVIYSCGHVHWVIAVSPPSFRLLLLALAGYFALALREEFAFRGYSLRRMETAWGMWPALVVIGIFFTLEHAAGGWNWSRVLLGPPAGALLFGMAALATRGLAVPVGIHTGFNFLQWVMGQKEVSGPFRLVVESGFAGQADAIGYAAYLVGMILAASGFWFWFRRGSKCDDARAGKLRSTAF